VVFLLNSFFDKFIFTNTLKFTHNNFYLVDIPFFISPIDSLSGLASVQDFEFQKKVYSSVKDSTKGELSKEFLKNFGVLEKGKELKLFEDFFSASGWGKLQGIDLQMDSKRAIIVLENSPFVASLKGKTRLPADVFLRGSLAGLFSVVFSDDIDCVEVECAALQGERCKFVLKPKQEFDFSNAVVQQQLSHE
jgi:predicted hydrocarbon binding protein